MGYNISRNIKTFKLFESGKEKISNSRKYFIIEEDIKDILLELIDTGKVTVGFNSYINNISVMIRTSQANKAIYWEDLSEYVNRIVDYLGDNFLQIKTRKHPKYRGDKNRNINTESDWIEINPNEDNSNIDYGLWFVIIKFNI